MPPDSYCLRPDAINNLQEFVASEMRQRDRLIAGRLQAALALLERLSDYPTLDLENHKKPSSTGLQSHETYGDRVHEKHDLAILNKNHGRRSSNVGGWGQSLLELVAQTEFAGASSDLRNAIIDSFQEHFAALIREMINADPIAVRISGRSAEMVICDVLNKATEKGKGGQVAQNLVGAKLMVRLGTEIEVIPANAGDRRSRIDTNARTGDYEIADTTIEVAIGPPDEKHLTQIRDILSNTTNHVWLLTRSDRVGMWVQLLSELVGPDMKRVVVAGVETFVGQNMSEMGAFATKAISSRLRELFDVYNSRWNDVIGIPGTRITVS